MGYFIAIMCGLAYRWVKIDTDDSSRKAGINVALLFVAAQCACKAYGGFISFFVFTALRFTVDKYVVPIILHLL